MKTRHLYKLLFVFLIILTFTVSCSPKDEDSISSSAGKSSSKSGSSGRVSSAADETTESTDTPAEESAGSRSGTSKSSVSSRTSSGVSKNSKYRYVPADDDDVTVPAGAKKTEKWTAVDLVFTAKKSYDNPYLNQAFNCEFTGPQGQKMVMPGFWDGDNKWVIRFAPPTTGKWTYTTKAVDYTDTGLNGIKGELYCVKNTKNLDVYKNGFLRVSNDKRDLTHRNGMPFFWLADTHTMGLSGRERLNTSNSSEFNSMFKGMVDVRSKQGYTVYQLNFFVSERGDIGGANGTYNEGGRVWGGGEKWVTLNPKFFQNCDERISYVAGKGLVSALGLDWGETANQATVGDFKAIARYVVARYSAYPVVWTIGGEARNNSPYWAEIGAYIDSIDPYQHPTTLHSGIEEGDWDYKSDEYRAEDWYDFVMLQKGHGGTLRQFDLNVWRDKWNRTPTVPFLESEGGYEGIKYIKDKNLARTVGYVSIMQGGFGYSYGAEGLWNATWDENDTHQIWADTPIPWYKAIKGENGAQMTYLKQIFTSVAWWDMKPYNSLIEWDKTTGQANDPMLKANSDRTSLIIYYPVPAAAINFDYTGTIKKLNSSHTYTALWRNPRTGEQTVAFKSFKPTAGGTWKTPKPPTRGDDWVLTITDTVFPDIESAKAVASSYEDISYPYITGESELPDVSVVYGTIYSLLDSFSTTQGTDNFYYRGKTSGGYFDLPVSTVCAAWNSALWGNAVWWEGAQPTAIGSGAIITHRLLCAGNQTDMVLEWRAPSAGSVWAADSAELYYVKSQGKKDGDGVLYTVKKNEEVVYEKNMNPNSSAQIKYKTGEIKVSSGDVIRLVLSSNDVWDQNWDQVESTFRLDFLAN